MADQIVRVITSDGAVMASAITGKALVEQARQIHKTLPVATAALGRSLMAASMMGNQLKGEENSLTLQIDPHLLLRGVRLGYPDGGQQLQVHRLHRHRNRR